MPGLDIFGRRPKKMHKINYLTLTIILAMLLSLAGLSFNVSAQPLAATSPTLDAAASYSVLGGQSVKNTGPTTMPGDLGVSPGSAVTGFPPGQVILPGHIHKADGSAHNAQIANSAAFDFLDQGCTTTYAGVKDLTGLSLGPGVYCADAFELRGVLTLLGNDVFIFKSAATLTTFSGSSITGGDPCNVWWREVSSATIGTGTKFIGNILASTSVTLQTGASLDGRAFAHTGSVSLDSNAITGEECLAARAPTATARPKPKPTAKSTNLPSSEQTATALASVPGLPSTGGGAPIQDEDFPWSLVFVSGLCAMAFVLGVRALRRAYRPKP
jgi:type VI secretion system secreted protein VgrG